MPHDGTLSGKYIVERADGQRRPNARYFVMDYASDPFALDALEAYADAAADDLPRLSADLHAVVTYRRALAAEAGDKARTSPARGRQAAGGAPSSDDDLLELLVRRASADADFAAKARAALDATRS